MDQPQPGSSRTGGPGYTGATSESPDGASNGPALVDGKTGMKRDHGAKELPGRLSAQQVMELAKIANSGITSTRWAAGLIGALGALLCLAAVFGQFTSHAFGLGIFMATMIVGGLLATAGPAVLARDHGNLRNFLRELRAGKTRSLFV